MQRREGSARVPIPETLRCRVSRGIGVPPTASSLLVAQAYGESFESDLWVVYRENAFDALSVRDKFFSSRVRRRLAQA